MDWTTRVQSLAEAKDFSSASASRLALGPTQPPIQWTPGKTSPLLPHNISGPYIMFSLVHFNSRRFNAYLKLSRNSNKTEYRTFRKPTTTDNNIHNTSCHPDEHKKLTITSI
jgi:hypothetical protein